MDLFTIGMARSKTSGGAADYHICSSSEYSSVTGLPTVTNPVANRLYLVPVSESAGNNHYNEYYYKNGNWELFGNGTKQIEFDNTPIQASENAVTSGGVYGALSEISGDLTELEARVNNTISAVGSPLIATTAADMTNIDKVYVYQGSETGYTSGNWYYYNGTSWASGGVYNATAVSTDKTLTVENTAADAKAVGDGLDNLINISTTQPSDSDNRLWINPENNDAIEIPTQAEMVAFETQVESTVEGLSESFAPEFDDATAYSIGDYVVNDGVLYKFTSNHAAGVWNNSHVQTVTVMNVVKGLGNDLDTLENTVGNIVDNTLSLSGKAADAKKTGDEISSIKDDLEKLGFEKTVFATLSSSDLENGSFDSDGMNIGSMNYRLRTINYIELPDNYDVYVDVDSDKDVYFNVWYYTVNDFSTSKIGYENWRKSGKLNRPTTAKYLRLCLSISNGSTTPLSPSDIDSIKLSSIKANVVKTTAQTLTDAEKAQARANIGAMSDSDGWISNFEISNGYLCQKVEVV